MTAKTSETLAQALDELGLHLMARRARTDEFHDFLSPHDTPTLKLVELLHHCAEATATTSKPGLAERIDKLRRDVINGDYDASLEESEEWANSEEGRAAFGWLINRD